MYSFLASQLDFVFFFYGLAFILLGASCFSVARITRPAASWQALGLFGVLHGGLEWLDLSALIVGDHPSFAAARVALMTGSFVFLLEFARLQALRIGWRMPGRWIYLPLLLGLGVISVFAGAKAGGVAGRYAIGLPAALAAAIVFLRHAEVVSGRVRAAAFTASVSFALYGLAAGLVTPAMPYGPAAVLNYEWFADLTGAPIQLARAMLACCIAAAVWTIWGYRAAAEISSRTFARYLRRQFGWTIGAMAVILFCGWTLTEYLGEVYRHNVQLEAQGDIDLLGSRLAAETATIGGMAKALAGLPAIVKLAAGAPNRADARTVLNLHVEAGAALAGYIFDPHGAVLAASDEAPRIMGASTRHLGDALAGRAGFLFEFDPVSAEPRYIASQPVRVGDRIAAVAVLVKSLRGFEADVRRLDRPYFLVNPDGVVALTNQPDGLRRTLWPLPEDRRTPLEQIFGPLDARPLLKEEVADASWTSVNGERDYVRRKLTQHGGWSLVILKPTREIFASRLLGIVITFLVTIMALIYILGRQRAVRDEVEMEKRLRLQKLADDLGLQAATDPLTGLNNRLRLEQTFAEEMAYAQRHAAPLSLVLFDVDRFKSVNDAYGHPVGDQALVRIAGLARRFVRTTDFLARWGGEEFLILLPGADGATAARVAEALRSAVATAEFEAVGSLTCSFGVAEFAQDRSPSEFLARADAALYRAKLSGRDRVETAPTAAAEDRTEAAGLQRGFA
ncbi:diguanylate cyclase [Hansschlegelia sp.]|uniref:GGDEF domain-containing protein n=1 Tax=Hansschlegelia sp. TaxID=2041892 RepID=UPI002C83CFA7|nr:diguanylate cyclase [Hansschlegelia sp.]HVI29983.1 diguanylate cyclase [Hansschlegelia sp.]